jgi:trigger factor
MKIEQKQLTDSKVEITFEFDKSDIEPQVAKATENLASNIKMDGFREGKVPANIVKQTVGDMNIFDEALRLTIQKKYPEYVEENNLGIISQPDVLITKLEPEGVSECKITVKILPVLSLKNYKEKASEALKDKKEVKVEDKEMEDTIK